MHEMEMCSLEMLQSSHRAATTNCVFLCLIANALGLCLAKTNKQTKKKQQRRPIQQFRQGERLRHFIDREALIVGCVFTTSHRHCLCHLPCQDALRTSRDHSRSRRWVAHIHGAEEECMSVTESLRYPKFTLLPDRASPPFLFLSGTCSFSSPSFSLLPLRFNWVSPAFSCVALPVLTFCCWHGSARSLAKQSTLREACARGDGAVPCTTSMWWWVLALVFCVPPPPFISLAGALQMSIRIWWSRSDQRTAREGPEGVPGSLPALCLCWLADWQRSHLSWQHWDKEATVSELPILLAAFCKLYKRVYSQYPYTPGSCLF